MKISAKSFLLLISCLPVSTAFGMAHDYAHVVCITQAQQHDLEINTLAVTLALMSLAARSKTIQSLVVPIDISADGLLLYKSYRQKSPVGMAFGTGCIVGEISPEIALLLSKVGLNKKYYEFLRNHRAEASLSTGLAGYVGYMGYVGAKMILNSLNRNKKEAR